jgi:predicted PurR-regulated permease PerM
MLAALVGVSAGGVVGALIAVPLVGAAKAMYLELRHPPASAQPPEA